MCEKFYYNLRFTKSFVHELVFFLFLVPYPVSLFVDISKFGFSYRCVCFISWSLCTLIVYFDYLLWAKYKRCGDKVCWFFYLEIFFGADLGDEKFWKYSHMYFGVY